MGIFRQEVTHVYRSSPTPFGLRWKHDQLRFIRIGWLLILAMVFMFTVVVEGAAYAHTNQQKQKQEKTVAKKTATKKVASANTSKKSAKSTSSKTSTKQNKISTTKAKTATTKAKPATTKAKAVKPKVSSVKSTPAKKTIASTVTQKKTAGSKKPASTQKPTSTKKSTPTKKPLHATLSKPTAKQVKKIIKGVTIYAYAPVVNRKTKKVDVTTSTGATATVGKTIAVDPKVIPLGWWVYVEGLGYRKAEDVGGSIKGKKIDVFVGSNKEARIFGVKKNRTLYVVGPNLPTPKTADKTASKTQKPIQSNTKTSSSKKIAAKSAGISLGKVKPIG